MRFVGAFKRFKLFLLRSKAVKGKGTSSRRRYIYTYIFVYISIYTYICIYIYISLITIIHCLFLRSEAAKGWGLITCCSKEGSYFRLMDFCISLNSRLESNKEGKNHLLFVSLLFGVQSSASSLSIYQSFYLSTRLSFFLSIYLSIHLSI